jgi:hypothetical protein
MKIANYSTLKSASKVAFSKDGDDIKLTQKIYDSSTGEAGSDSVSDVNLSYYENQKAHKEAEKARLTSEITQLTAIISDIKAL